jgi:hypothetical protein
LGIGIGGGGSFIGGGNDGSGGGTDGVPGGGVGCGPCASCFIPEQHYRRLIIKRENPRWRRDGIRLGRRVSWLFPASPQVSLVKNRGRTLGSIRRLVDPENAPTEVFPEGRGIAQSLKVEAEHNVLTGHPISKNGRFDPRRSSYFHIFETLAARLSPSRQTCTVY